MSLKEYTRKRDFKKTDEPRGQHGNGAEHHRFVIQKHAASRLHYDFRLEMGGTLKSWAVPKGIPFAKGEKRLAVQVEDHPVSYINFEGTIPQGQYGGGTVMVWDCGTFQALSDSPQKELASGKLHFVLKGKKLKGEWYLVRLRDENQWLLIKAGEDLKPVSKKMDDTSARSGKSLQQLSKSDQVWQSNRPERNGHAHEHSNGASTAGARLKKNHSVSPAQFPQFVEPMKARLVEQPPTGDWTYEIKFDGFRTLAFKRGDAVRLLSRNEKDFGEKFPDIAEATAQLAVADVVMDGEIVALDSEGRSSFQLLQRFELGQTRPPIFFYAFDLLRLDGRDLMNDPIEERKARLERLLKHAPDLIRFSSALGSDAERLLPKIRRLGLEGLIGKRQGSRYEPGSRNGAWVKLKVVQEQELVIGGYTNPAGSRPHFGALLVGYHDDGEFKFAGKVGTGFNTALLKNLHSRFQKISTDRCPFANLPEQKKSRYGQSMTTAEMKRCHWLKPKMVCQVKFSEWTQGGSLRQPVFLGLREDKDSTEVVREKPQ